MFQEKMIHQVVLAAGLCLLGLSGCSYSARPGLSPEEYGDYSTFFTPTHSFSCALEAGFGKMSAEFVPGKIFGAFDLGGHKYSIQGKAPDRFPPEVVGLIVRYPSPAMDLYVVIWPNGEFALEHYPLAGRSKLRVDLSPKEVLGLVPGWKCTNRESQPAFKSVTAELQKS